MLKIRKKNMSMKRKSFPHLDREVEEKIADWFQKQEILYRADAEGYSNKAVKDTVWAEGAQLIGIEEEHLRHFIRGMRTLYSKLVKPGRLSCKGAANLTGRKQWTLKNFEFLRNHIQHRTADIPGRREEKEEYFEEDNYDDDEEILVAVDCASELGIQEGEPSQYGTIDPSTDSANGPHDPPVNNIASSTQRQILKRPAELQCDTQLSRLRSTQQPIPNTVKRSRKNVSSTWSKFHMDSPCPVFTNHTRASMDDGGRAIIKQIGESTKADVPRKGMDDQVKSFLEMMGTTMMSLHPKRRLKAQRKLLNLMFDELEQQEIEDTQPSTSPSCTSFATSEATSPPPHSVSG